MQSCQIIHLIEGKEGFGVATVLRQIIKNLPFVKFIALSPGKFTQAIPAEQLLWVGEKDLNIRIGRSTLGGFVAITKNIFRWWSIAKHVVKILPAEPVLFHCHHLFTTLLAVMIKFQRPKSQTKILYHFHSIMNRKRLFGLLPRLQRFVIGRSVDGIVAVSSAVADYWRPVRCRIWVVHNGMAKKPIAPMREELKNYQDKRNILIAASISREKGQMVAVEAMKLLGPRADEFHLWIAGCPIDEALNPFAGELKAAIERYGLNQTISLLGQVENIATIAPFTWAALQLRITPEPCAMWVLEALSFGLAIVATNNGGTQELVRHEIEGLLIRPNDPQALADAILRLADDESLHDRLAEAAALRARDFTVEAFIAKLRGVYTDLGATERK
mgnify:CR=1 FL=1